LTKVESCKKPHNQTNKHKLITNNTSKHTDKQMTEQRNRQRTK